MFTAYHGVAADQHQANFNSLSARGFRMISLSVYGVPSDARMLPYGFNVRARPGWRFTEWTARDINRFLIIGHLGVLFRYLSPPQEKAAMQFLPQCLNRESSVPGSLVTV